MEEVECAPPPAAMENPWLPPATIPIVPAMLFPPITAEDEEFPPLDPIGDLHAIYDPPIILREPVQLAASLWIIEWETEHPGPFYVYVDGEHILTTRNKCARIVAEAAAGEHPVIDVSTTPGYVPERVHSSRLVLEWDADAEAERYDVEQWSGSAWSKIAEVPRGGAARERYRTVPLADGAEHKFRVKTIKPNQTPSTGTEFKRFVVRAPDPPNVTMWYGYMPQAVTIE